MDYLDSTGLIQFGSRVNYKRYFKTASEEETVALVDQIRPTLRKYGHRFDTVDERKEDLGEGVAQLYKFYPIDSTATKPNLDMAYNVNIKNSQLLTALVIPELDIETGSTIDGHIKMPHHDFLLNVNSPGIKYNDSKIVGIKGKLTGEDYLGSLSLNVGHVEHNNIRADSIIASLQTFNQRRKCD